MSDSGSYDSEGDYTSDERPDQDQRHLGQGQKHFSQPDRALYDQEDESSDEDEDVPFRGISSPAITSIPAGRPSMASSMTAATAATDAGPSGGEDEDSDEESSDEELTHPPPKRSPVVRKLASPGPRGETDDDSSDEDLDDDEPAKTRSPPPSVISARPPGASRGKELKKKTKKKIPSDSGDSDDSDDDSPTSDSSTDPFQAKREKKAQKNENTTTKKKKMSMPVKKKAGPADKSGKKSTTKKVVKKKKKTATDVSPKKAPSSKKKKKPAPSTSSSVNKKRSAPSSKKAPPKKKIKKSLSSSDDTDEEENGVMAAVVLEDDDDVDDSDEEIVAVAVATPVVSKTGKAKKKKHGMKSKAATADSKKKKKKPELKKKKGKKSSPPSDDDDSTSSQLLTPTPVVSDQAMEAASNARSLLFETVSRLPLVVSDSHTLRSLGQIKIEDGVPALDALYSSASSIHPVGFSCDRYEFSPAHGRVIKMRCDILDGSAAKKKWEERRAAALAAAKKKKKKKRTDDGDDDVSDNEDADEKKDDSASVATADSPHKKEKDKPPPCGPVFRVMWGPGVDEDPDLPDHPYDPFSASAPLGGDVDAVAVPLTSDGKAVVSKVGGPEVGMRVSVRFDQKNWYAGTVTKVTKVKEESGKGPDKKKGGGASEKKKKKKRRYKIRIEYDDGATEEAAFPDPDIVLRPPGYQEGNTDEGAVEVTEISGKPVTCIIGKSALESWGKTLIALGLIDEIMYESALEALELSRQERRAEVMDKLEAQKLQRQQARARHRHVTQGEKSKDDSTPSPIIVRVVDGEVVGTIGISDSSDEEEGFDKENAAKEKEPPTERENFLQEKFEALREKYDQMRSEDRLDAVALADARLAALGPFYTNPFNEQDSNQSQQASWLATVIRKEKAKMGSTGNKRKIVTETDLLERNDTFFNAEIERLVEGLPGSEYCSPYIFHECRAGGAAAASQAWVHEAHIRQEREREKQMKSVKEAKEKESQMREKELKRKKRDELRESRKRQKREEEEKKRKAREEDRLSRLAMQVDERLFKEACFQREKVVLLAAKSLGKEFTRRRKASEVLSSFILEGSETKSEDNDIYTAENEVFRKELPPLSRRYDGDVVRVWDFLSSFREAFEDRDTPSPLPTLDSLQNAIDSLRGENTVQDKRYSKSKAVDLLVNLAIVLCKPLAPSLVKQLSSVVSASTAPQKENNVAVSGDGTLSVTSRQDADASTSTFTLPVNSFTWREVARLTFLADALSELGYSKQESANILRGYRSGGHPNSKEAKRLRRGEDSVLVSLRQVLTERCTKSAAGGTAKNVQDEGGLKIRITVPCRPSAGPSDWTFYLHNIKSLPPAATPAILTNLRKALALLKTAARKDLRGEDGQSIKSDLERSLAMYERVSSSSGLGSSDVNTCNRARLLALRVLDRVSGETYSTDVSSQTVYRDMELAEKEAKSMLDSKPSVHKAFRQRMGLLQLLFMTEEEYKKAIHERENYISAALRHKEDMERKKKKADKEKSRKGSEEEDEEEDDDEGASDDDDDDDDADDESGNEDQKKSVGEEAVNTTLNETETEAMASVVENIVPQKNESSNDTDGSKKAERTVTEQPEASSTIVATVVETKTDEPADGRIGKKTRFDDFCGDDPKAPEFIRRCLAVLRALCLSAPAEPFIYPVDPQANPRYYESILRPMCFQDIGNVLLAAGKRLSGQVSDSFEKLPAGGIPVKVLDEEAEVESVVARFARDVRLVAQNCSCYSSVGAALISSAEEMLRIFERLFLDWVLSPPHLLPPLELLDDDRCVEYHPSDEDALILLCDGCEGKYNMSRLDPPLFEVPKGDWYCPRCLSGRCWAQIDPRIGRKVKKKFLVVEEAGPPVPGVSHAVPKESVFAGTIKSCLFRYPEGENSKPGLMYVIKYDIDGDEETWTLEDVDRALKEDGDAVPPVRCLEAVAESPGYGVGTDHGPPLDFLPALVNPTVSDLAAQATANTSVFLDTIIGFATLTLSHPEEMNPSEWLRLLVLLIMKCTTTDVLQNLSNKLENEASDKVSKELSEVAKIRDIREILPQVTDEESEAEGCEEKTSEIIEETQRMPKSEAPRTDQRTFRASNNKKEILYSRETSTECGKVSELSEEAEQKDNSLRSPEGEQNNGNKGRQRKSRALASNGPSTMVIEPSDVEVVDMKAELVPTSSDSTDLLPFSNQNTDAGVSVVAEVTLTEEELWRRSRESAMATKARRQKAREDGIMAVCIKNHFRPIVASFEEDTLSQIIDSALGTKELGLGLGSCRCRGKVCDFCGLSDLALGTQLFRVPNQKEWDEIIPHACNNRLTRMIAEVDENPARRSGVSREGMKSDVFSQADAPCKANDPANVSAVVADVPVSSAMEQQETSEHKMKLLIVSVRVGGEIISSNDNSTRLLDCVQDGGMLEFLPRNDDGFQYELDFRAQASLPFITGSSSAHDCCAIAAHNARKEKRVQEYKEQFALVAERDAAASCGRTLCLGTDKWGRSYWKFNSDSSSLFVFVENVRQADSFGRDKKWNRFSDTETIASIIVCLGKNEPARELRRVFPEAAKFAATGQWAELIQKRSCSVNLSLIEQNDGEVKMSLTAGGLPNAACDKAKDASKSDVSDTTGAGRTSSTCDVEPSEEEEPYEEGEDVLVESGCGKLLWDATIIAISKRREDDAVNGYRVHYKEWSSRFDEWVKPFMVVEPSDNNVQVQEEMLEEMLASKQGVPAALENITAKSFLHSRHRSRGAAVAVPNLSEVSEVGPGASVEDKTFGLLKAALLMIEAALPSGAVDVSFQGVWKPEVAAFWRVMVKEAMGPSSLMGCVVLLEDAVSAEWLLPHAEYLLACMPKPWKAVAEASLSSVAMRIWLLDQGIKFNVTDKVRNSSSSSRGRRSR